MVQLQITSIQLAGLQQVFKRHMGSNGNSIQIPRIAISVYVCSNTLHVFHTYGFFSGCSVIFHHIGEYYTMNKMLPFAIDSSNVFVLYEPIELANSDIRSEFFNESTIEIPYGVPFTFHLDDQFKKYSTFNFKALEPFLTKYFSPSQKILDIYTRLVKKYSIDLENCIGLYYRGTDKIIEMPLDTFDSYLTKLNEVLLSTNSSSTQILVQTDSGGFLDFMKEKLKDKNVIIIHETSVSYTLHGIHNEKTQNENFIEMQHVMAAFLILSKCKHLICSSGNTSMWMALFRGHGSNIYQNMNRSWI